ncbi:MAG: DUF2920 family protein [Lachnospiraceae bacterium]|nr:DUF2920 family protein [Lachnospiraceae bacterium]
MTKDTGILMFICGYGANSQSNVFRKMRDRFADSLNMITVQCDYFGLEYMWTPKSGLQILQNLVMGQEELSCYSEDEAKAIFFDRIKNNTYKWTVRQKESLGSLNDMGPVQAMDILNALYSLDSFLSVNGIDYDRHKIVVFGNSHGAYLAELCNSYMPGVISAIIDLGGYVFPGYLSPQGFRTIRTIVDGYNAVLDIRYDDLIKHIVMDREIYDLKALYADECGKAKIIAFHGEDDFLTPPDEKKEYIGRSDNWIFNLITGDDVDGEIITSSAHNLGADFIKLIQHTFDNYTLRSDEEKMRFGSTVFETDTAIYDIAIRNGRPDMICHITGQYDYDKIKDIAKSRPESEFICL